jgi:class 3 adenylate cyclase
MIGNELGDEYLLLERDSLWINRITKEGSEKEPSINVYLRETEEMLEKVGEDRLDRKYDPRSRPWFQLALDNPPDSVISWTDPYIFFTTEQPGITASIRWQDPVTKIDYICAIDVLITDLSDFTTTINITENGKVFILSEQLDVIGLPRDQKFLNKNVRNEYSLKKLTELNIPLLDAAIQRYKIVGDSINFVSFDFEDELWWGGFDLFPLNENKNLIVGVIVPETDFLEGIKDTRHLLIGGLLLIILFFFIILYTFLRMKKANKIIAFERDKSEQLLLNTLPVKVVNDLKVAGRSIPQKFENVTVCFADIVGFTQISSQLDPKELIDELNKIYTGFDEIMIQYDCERIKTIGDAYLAVCGMPEKNERHAEMMLRAAIEILNYLQTQNKSSALQWQMRIGLHSGNVVGGIVGVKKYIYDVFGDTINTASRMESYSQPMVINLSEQTYEIVKDSEFVKKQSIEFKKRAPVVVKGKGLMNMYYAQVAS